MNYMKALMALGSAILSGVVAALVGDMIVSAVEWVNIAILGVGAASVFAAPNVPGARYTKAVLAALAAVLVLLVDLMTGGVSGTEWLQLAVAGLGALGVYFVPNTQPGDVNPVDAGRALPKDAM